MDSPVRGRPMAYTPETLQTKINEYFRLCDENAITVDSTKGPLKRQRPYTISGLCIFLGISRDTWMQYSNRPEFKEVCALGKLRAQDHLMTGALVGEFHPIVAIFIGKNDFQMTDRFDLGVNPPVESLTPEQIRQELEARRRLELTDGGGD